jgi:pimeloyl-ACP methyl ester carboxylesterase
MRTLLTILAAAVAANPGAPLQAQTGFFHEPVTFVSRTADNDSVVRVYIDREGNLYPEAATALDSLGLKAAHARVFEYYRTRRTAWADLLRTVGMAPAPFTAGAWEESQSALLRRLRERIVSRVGRGRSPVVVLVHGFNVPSASRTYNAAMSTIAPAAGGARPLYVHVHWDGDHASSKVGVLQAWFQANRNAPLVGLELRRVLAGIPSEVPVRVITHSLGGSVIAAALWTRGEYAGRREPEFTTYIARSAEARRYPLPVHPDLRVGMVVPAMGGRAFGLPTGARRSDVELMMVGQNDQDVVVTKGWISPLLFGSTALAVKVTEYCRHVFPVYSADRDRATQRVDFNLPGSGDFAHGFDVYLRRRKPMESFLEMLLAREGDQLADTDQCSASGKGK